MERGTGGDEGDV